MPSLGRCDIGQASIPLALAVGAAALAWYYWPRGRRFLLDRKTASQRKRIRVADVVEITHDVKQFRLSLGDSQMILGLPVGKHIKVYAPNPKECLASNTWNGNSDPDRGSEEISRSYTPVTGDEVQGYVDLVVKIYRPGSVKMADGTETVWADGGKLSRYLDVLKKGDFIEISGPVGVNEYLGRGRFKYPGSDPNKTFSHVGMMAGGSGITPMLQVVSAALRDESDTTKFNLIYANKTQDDILVRDLLEDAVNQSNGRFKVYYTLDFPPEGWAHKKGFITADMIKECLPPVSEKPLMLMCGPPGMVQHACKKNLLNLGYEQNTMVAF